MVVGLEGVFAKGNILFLDGSCFTFFPSLESLGCAHVSLFSIIFHAFFSVPDNFQSPGVNELF